MDNSLLLALQDFQFLCAKQAKDKGFGEGAVNIDQKLLLCVGELIEAQEELRSGHTPQAVYHQDGKPEGFPIELADAVIRLFDLADRVGVNLAEALQTKLAYNVTRPFKHGKAF